MPAADVAAAKAMTKYLQDAASFLGLKKPDRVVLTKDIITSHPMASHDELETVVRELYALPQREFHYTALEVFSKAKKVWEPKASLDLARYMVVTEPWWDTVDMIASHAVGGLRAKFPADRQLKATVASWIADDSFWVQRASILHQLRFRDKTDESLLFASASHLLSNKRDPAEYSHARERFFLDKAIGWALRQYSTHNPEAVANYVAKHSSLMSKLTFREATRRLPADLRTELAPHADVGRKRAVRQARASESNSAAEDEHKK